MSKIHEDLKAIDKEGFVAHKMAGGNAGAALGGLYIAEALNGLTDAILKLANRPITVHMNVPPSPMPQVPPEPTTLQRKKK